MAKKESAPLTMGYSSNVKILKEGTEIFSLFSTTCFPVEDEKPRQTYSATRFTNFLSGCVSFLTLTIKF